MTASGSGRRAACSALAVLCTALMTSPTAALDTSYRISTGAVLTDNIDQAPRGQEESELVLFVTPGLTLSSRGGRGRVELNYSASGLYYTRESDSRLRHQLRSLARTELVPELLFLDADASYDQELVSTRPDLGADLIRGGGGVSDVFRYRISPYVQQRYGPYARGELRLQHRAVDYRDADGVDSETNGVAVRIDSGPAFSTFDWELRYARDRVDYDDDSRSEFERYSGLLRYHVTDQVSVFGEAGRERDRFDQGDERSRPSGNLWRTGVTWTPTTRTRIDAFYADRYFGSYFGGSVRHRFRSSTWVFDYREEPTTAALVDPTAVGLTPPGEEPSPVLDQEGNPVFLDADSPRFTTEAFVRRRATLSVQGQLSRFGWRVRAFEERRDYEFSDRDESVLGVGLGLNYLVAPRTRVSAGYDWLRTKGQDDLGEERSQRASLGVQYQLSRNSDVLARYDYLESDGVEGGREGYRENRASVFFSTRF